MMSVWVNMQLSSSPLQMIHHRTRTPHTHTPAWRGRSFLKVVPAGQPTRIQLPIIWWGHRTFPLCLFCLWTSFQLTRLWWSSRIKLFHWLPMEMWNILLSERNTSLWETVHLCVQFTGDIIKEHTSGQYLMKPKCFLKLCKRSTLFYTIIFQNQRQEPKTRLMMDSTSFPLPLFSFYSASLSILPFLSIPFSISTSPLSQSLSLSLWLGMKRVKKLISYYHISQMGLIFSAGVTS